MTHPHGMPRRTALGVLVTGALAACGLSPDHTIRSGLDVNAPVDNRLDVVPVPPRSGDGPEAIIRGFLEAGEASGSGLDVARQYLTRECAEGWNPDINETIVHPSERESISITEAKGKEGSYEVTVPVVARIDQDARYLVAESTDSAAFEFGLTKVDGEWRIDRMQTSFGRVLSTRSTGRVYRQYHVHYPANASNVLVPDQRWVMEGQQATRLAQVQLGGVPDYLDKAVAPSTGAELALESVPVMEGVARVDLRAASVPSESNERERLVAQLVATLMQVPDVSEVALTLDGAPLSLPGLDGPLTSPEQLDYVSPTGLQDPLVLGRTKGRLVKVSETLAALTKRELRSARTRFRVAKKWSRLALRSDGSEAAGVTDKGFELVRWRSSSKDEPIVVPAFAANLTRPCYDNGSVLWVGGVGLGSEVGHRLFHINTRADLDDVEGSGPRYVPTPWLEANYVVAAVVSADGSRIAVISEVYPGQGSDLWVSGIVRESNGLPEGTSPDAVQAGADLIEMLDVVWVEPTTLAVIGRHDKQEHMSPYLVGVNGEVTALSWPPLGAARKKKDSEPVAVTTTDGADAIIVTSADGRLWQRLGDTGWTEIELISDVVTAGV
ncbi:GerMN domain-containing protein [Janibacter corallicola]|uniref:GerMN domain-containing protein n=1 Tax=Janibacter corallicola TaxID=415212 RepID=UPI00082B71F3|nr:GerMN domain-containing protein [Janibacter corallicola]